MIIKLKCNVLGQNKNVYDTVRIFYMTYYAPVHAVWDFSLILRQNPIPNRRTR